jgi:cysteine-rich repeat protein
MKRFLSKLLVLATVFSWGTMAYLPVAYAQDVADNLDVIGEQSGLGDGDIKLTVGRLIRTGLSLLGVVAVCIVLYGGWVWMTAGGDTEKVDRARRILINGVIGLVIILMAWGITTFIITSILDATGGGYTGDDGGPGGPPSTNGTTLFEVTGISPEGTQIIRNIQVQIAFTKSVLDTSLTGAITVTNSSTNEEVEGTLTVSGKRVTFVPSAPCPSPNEDRFCFDENTAYTVSVSEDIESTSGVVLTCLDDSCTGSFTSGTIVDTEDPVATMTAPDDHSSISVDAVETVEVQATDDAGVAVADFSIDGGESFESVIASGDDLTDVVMQGIWDTTGLSTGEEYEVQVTVTDVAGNTDDDAVTVTARPATCFNNVLDTGMGETDVDCGGDESSPNYCGACEGGSCSEESDCGGGACEVGICTDTPTISSISPDNGAEGTFVTILGSGFGSTEGTVLFSQENGGTIAAVIASCSNGWSDDEIIVVVPAGAEDGPISVIAASGEEDATDDENGELIPDFDINDTIRPALCGITPESGMSAEAFVLSGSGFGSSRGSSTVIFGNDEEPGSYSGWSDASISGTVPSINEGNYSVYVVAGDVESNSVTFEVIEEAATDAPNIVSIDPESGGPGQYITITGSSFGSTVGNVWFTSGVTGERTQASIDFPSTCSDDFWSETEVTVIVPEVAVGNYTITVESRSGESSPVAFVVSAEEPTPGLCAISPDSGDVGDTIVAYGDNFGTTTGTVSFAGGVSATPSSWDNGEVRLVVPEGATTGSLKVVSAASVQSNELTFTVGSGTSTASSGISASYAWSFSSGEIPDVPELITACTETQISAVPNDRFSDEACVNAQVYVEFTVDMNEATLDDGLTVEKCVAEGDEPCDETNSVTGTYETTATSVTFNPDADFDVSTTYQVTVSPSAISADGVALAGTTTWTFTTKADGSACDVESVVVSPDAATLKAENDTKAFSAFPIANCSVLDADDFVWGWNINESYARFSAADRDCAGGGSACATAEALAEGTTNVAAEETASGEVGVAVLTINFSDPYITQYFPDCTEACVNATVGARFNVPMDAASVESGAELYLCANELCTSLTEVVGASAGCEENEDGECVGFTLTLPSETALTAGEYYRVIASGTMESTSGVPLIRTNYGNDFSWTFRVREDGTVCAVERVAVTPASATSSEVGDQKVFTAEAYGEADSCSVSGQLLNSFSYAWNWENPIEDENNDGDGATVVATWGSAGLADSDPTSVPEGCTSSCTAAGSASYSAVCGDGILETDEGEECEDGNVASLDGCSSSCLREGSEAVTYACSRGSAICGGLTDDASCAEVCEAGTCSISGTACTRRIDCVFAVATCDAVGSGCGDGDIDASEDCDDGNVIDGDGCSVECLAEGSSAIGATCGNNDVAYDIATYAGEECDDGNGLNNDGCSASCTNEGSPTLASIGGAVCGDGTVDAPYEACDDGDTDDNDGCSSACLYEGSSLSYAEPSSCGDGVQGIGEECDNGDDESGDGCSSDCILEGSSASYEIPSYCGDGVVGTGETDACEVGASGDGDIDPVQVAAIDPTAVFEVDSETGEAVATIRATEFSSEFTGESTWTLFCAATSDDDCEDPAAQGVGTGNCCMDRPVASLTPADTTLNVCRNAALYATFTQPMDTESFTYETDDGDTSYHMYAALDISTSEGICPSTHTTLAQAPSGFFVRAWRTLQRWIFGERALATAGDCVLPISRFQQQESEGSYLVHMNASELMYAGGVYTLVVEGDGTITDGTVEGVASRYGVGVNGDTTATFTVGSEICAADAVEVTDSDEENPGVFSSLDDEHLYTASVLSYSAGTAQEIVAIPGVYDWTWSSWSSDDEDVLTVVQDATNTDTAIVSPAGENGTANIVATLTIQNNTSGIETESAVSGSSQATAFLCENPWPAIESYPWTDDEDWTTVGSEVGIGWTHFSFGYCRDTEDASVNYPALTVISPNDPGDDVILKEYIFKVQGTSDAIGVRIASNPNYLSPIAWYDEQGFTGSPSETTIDGFPAVEDGRTTYISAPNLDEDGNYLYSNMYIVSYNDNAGDDAAIIYEQIIENFTLGTNLSSVGYCAVGSSYSTACTSDLDCDVSIGESCADLKGKLARDTQRLSDMTDLRIALEVYGEDSGYCSATTSKICSEDADCPDTETCIPGVPTLPSGTFVRAFASSVWGSWEDMLGGALDENIGSDPLNVYDGCGEGVYAAYDAETCVDETRGLYVCPNNSHAYHYQAYGTEYAYLYSDLEYASVPWYYPIDDSAVDDSTTILVGNAGGSTGGFSTTAFCDGTVYGSSGTCGDGVVNTSIDSDGNGTADTSEVCEIGEAGGVSQPCDGDNDGTDDGYISQICNSSCTAFIDNAAATCTPTSCGNGVVEGTETCDDGTANGRYGYCGSDCTYTTAVFCGDGELSGGELCDCGDTDVFSSIPSTGRAYGTSSVGTCTEYNGEYNASPSVSCAWDCSGAAGYCGDGEITGSEQCDGEDDTWSGELCSGGTNAGYICTTDADCAGGGVCGGSGSYAACDTGYTRVLPCDDDAGASCTYTSSWLSVSCTEVGSCGDGVVDPDEACDDGNTDGTDACTTDCTENICGDGFLYSGEEECDEGTGNGSSCEALYGSTCSACTTSCRITVSSGAFCGDGEINGSEFCDASDIPYRYYDSTTGTEGGACTAGDPAYTDGSGVTYTCRRLGMCDGGPENGEYCTSSTGGISGTDLQVCDANGSTSVACVFPDCADSCVSSCPLTEVATSLLLTPNLSGSPDGSSADLYSYSTDSTSELPNAATITMPACTVAGNLTGTIDMSNVDLPNVYVLFVTDRSGSMSTALGTGTRMSVARSLLSTSVTALYEGLGEDMYVSLEGYSYDAGTGICTGTYTYSCDSDDDCSSDQTCENQLTNTLSYGFGTTSNESTLQSRIAEFTERGSTYTGAALTEAKEILDAVPDDGNVRKIVVLLSDGDPTDSPSSAATALKSATTANGANYELYTVALTTDTDLIADMNSWSSNDGETASENGIDYAYDGDTVTELEAAYESIIDSILGITVGVISSDGTTAELTTGIMQQGNNLTFPWPENFTCDPEGEQEVPIQLTFLGEGTINLSNLRIEYCAP